MRLSSSRVPQQVRDVEFAGTGADGPGLVAGLVLLDKVVLQFDGLQAPRRAVHRHDRGAAARPHGGVARFAGAAAAPVEFERYAATASTNTCNLP